MNARKKVAALAGAAVVLAITGTAWSQGKSTAEGIAEYRRMLEDGNPAELYEAKGEALWKKKRGPKNASLEQCDLGKGPGVIKGVFVELPRYFADTQRVQDMESRLLTCMETLQGLDAVFVGPAGVADLDADAGVGDGAHQLHVTVDLGRHRDQAHRRLVVETVHLIQRGFARIGRLGAQLARIDVGTFQVHAEDARLALAARAAGCADGAECAVDVLDRRGPGGGQQGGGAVQQAHCAPGVKSSKSKSAAGKPDGAFCPFNPEVGF